MANEATKIDLYGNNAAGEVMPFTVSSSASIPKGSLMVLSASPRTAAIHSAADQVFLGVANAEKDSSDSSTQLGVWTNGIFEVAASGSISDGDTCVLSETVNYVMTSADATALDQAQVVGTALKDAAGGLVVVRVLK